MYVYVLTPCASTSCQRVSVDPTGPPSGTATLDVWANYTGGAVHFSKTAPLTVSQGAISIQGHVVTALTVQLRLDVAGASVSGYSGSLLVYTCSACGDQQASIGSVAVTGALSRGVIPASQFPALATTSNLTVLVWPDAVAVTLAGGQKLVLGMSPVVVSNLVSGTPAPPPAACPATVPIYVVSGGTLDKVGTATLVSYADAVAVWGGTTQSDIDMTATYYLGSYSITSVIVPGMGGSSAHPSYGLLSGYHYTSTGACVS